MTTPADIPDSIRQWAADFWDAHLETDQVDMVALAFMAGQGAGTPPTKFGLTSQQLEVLEWVEAYSLVQHGVSPSIREIAHRFDFSVSHAHSVVTALVSRGFLTRLPGKARSLALVQVHHVSAAHIISGVA